jgi:GAF domain-containing protein
MVRRDGSRFVGHLTAAPMFGDDKELVGMIGVIRDVTEKLQLDEQLHTRRIELETLARLGARAVAKGRDIEGIDEAVLEESAEAARRVLGTDWAAILEVAPGDRLVVRASSPRDSSAGVPGGSRSLAGYTVLARTAIVVEDAARERRFDLGPLAGRACSAIAAPVFGPRGVRAVLTAESATPRCFDQASVHFVQAIANVVGMALQ